MKKILGMVVAGASLLTLAACSSGNNQNAESAVDKKEVVIGLDNTFVPMGFQDDAGDLVGFDVDLANAVFEGTGTKVKFQPIDWSMKEAELKNGTIDMIWNGYTKTSEREKKVLFTETYMKNTQVLVTSKKSKITSFEKMKDKKLGAQEGSSGYDAFNNQPKILKDNVADNDATLYASFNEAFIDLESGRIDGLLIDQVYADYYLNQTNKIADYTITVSPYKTEDFAVGVRKDDEALAEKINDGLKKAKDSGKFKEISEKWFGEDVSEQ